MTSLTLEPFDERPELLAAPVLAALRSDAWDDVKPDVYVAEIDPANMGGEKFCATYDVAPTDGANCVILEAKRGEKVWYVGTLVPVGCRMDIGGAIRRFVNARKVGVAPLNYVLEATGMEYGSITTIGLPSEWTILVDDRLLERPFLFVGSGLARSKLRVPGRLFRDARVFTPFPGLGIDVSSREGT